MELLTEFGIKKSEIVALADRIVFPKEGQVDPSEALAAFEQSLADIDALPNLVTRLLGF